MGVARGCLLDNGGGGGGGYGELMYVYLLVCSTVKTICYSIYLPLS